MGSGGLMMVAAPAAPGGVALLPFGTSLVAEGVVMTAHGGVVMSKALLEFAKHKNKKARESEWSKRSGRGGPHTNLKAKRKAQEAYEEMKADLAKYKAEHGHKCDKKKLEWFKKQLKHLKRKADKTGETHGRKGKEYR